MKKVMLIVTTALSLSCGDYLDVPPHDALSGTTVTMKDIPALMNGMYHYCQRMPQESYILNDIIGGFAHRHVHSSAIESINYYTQIDNEEIKNIWNSYFITLAKVNNVITLTNNAVENEVVLKSRGAAHFMRAYIYLGLVTHWGDVPILEKSVETPFRSPASEVWKFIENDLNTAIGCLKPFREDKTGYYFVTQEAAMALKARMLLYVDRKAEAAQLAESLITQGQFSLDSFDKIFRGEPNAEIIFAFLNLTEESGTNLSTLFYNYDHPNSGSYFQHPTNDIMTLFDDNDNRKDISWTNQYGGVNCFNKYPSGQLGSDPIIVVRIAEMFLISAEAKGLNGGGLHRLNELRRKRGLENLNPAPVTEDEFIEVILSERDKELLTENHRFYDLVRTEKTAKIGIKDHQKLLPIPETQRRLNPNLGQNAGY